MLKHPKSKSLCVVSLFCASALFIACNKPESEKPEPEPEENIPQIEISIYGNISMPLEGGEVVIPYTIVNPVEGGELSAGAEVDWITDFTYPSDTTVVCSVLENIETESRSAVITLKYDYSDAAEPVIAQINLIQEPAIDWDYDMKATDFRGHYYDTRYGHDGEHNYYTWLSDMPFDEDGKTQAGGTYYLFDMYAGAPEDPLKPLPPAGTYTLGEAGSTVEMTFSSDYSSVRATNDIGEITIQEYFSEGTLTVAYENDSLKMEAELTDRAGALHRVIYEAPVPEYLFGDAGVGEEYLSIERDMNVVPFYVSASYFNEKDGVMEVYMTFTDTELEDGELVSPGSALKLDGVYMPFDEDGKIAVGTYRLTADYGDAFTLYAGEMYSLLGFLFPYGCYLEYYDENGDLYYGFAVDGTMTVGERSGGGYDISIDFYTAEGHRITCDYSGELEISGMPGPLSRLTDDYTLEFAETVASGYYYGDVLSTGGGNWYVKISPKDGLTGDGFITYLVGEGLDFAAGIPSGTYKAAASANYIYPNEYQVGYLSGSGLGGTMYLGGYTEAGVTMFAPAMSGDLNIVNHGDGSYTFTFSFLDDKGFTWDGEWSGSIDFSNVSYSPAGPVRIPYK